MNTLIEYFRRLLRRDEFYPLPNALLRDIGMSKAAFIHSR